MTLGILGMLFIAPFTYHRFDADVPTPNTKIRDAGQTLPQGYDFTDPGEGAEQVAEALEPKDEY